MNNKIYTHFLSNEFHTYSRLKEIHIIMVILSLKYVNFVEFEFESLFTCLKTMYNLKNPLYI